MKHFFYCVAMFALIFLNGKVMANPNELSKDKTLNISFFEVNRESANRLIFEESITLPKDRSKKTITVETSEKKGVFSAPITIEGVASTEGSAAVGIYWEKKAKFYRVLDHYDPTEMPRKTNGFTLLVQPQVFDKTQSRARISVDNKEYEVVFSWAENSKLPIISRKLHIEIIPENNVEAAVSWEVKSEDIKTNENSSVRTSIEGLKLHTSNGETKDAAGYSDILFNMEDPDFIFLKMYVYTVKYETFADELVLPFAEGTSLFQKIRLLDGQTHEERFTLRINGEPISLIYKLKWL